MVDPVGVTGLIIAILGLSQTVTQFLGDIKNASGDRIRLLCEIASVSGLLSILKDQAQQAESTDPWRTTIACLDVPRGPLEQFKVALEQLASRLAPTKGLENIGKTLTWPFQKQEVKEILNTIERLKSLFALALDNDHIKLSQAIKDDIAKVGHELRDISGGVGQLQGELQSFKNDLQYQERRDIISWLSRSNHWTKQIDIFNRKQEGTGTWVFEDQNFKHWLDGTTKTLICTGIPGTGKTVLASTIIDHLQQTVRHNDVGVAYIYCNYREQDQSPTNSTASLLQQLVEQRGVVSEEVRSIYTKHFSQWTRPTQAEYSKLLQVEINRFSKVMIVVDALDECPESNGAREYLLRGLQKLVPKVHLLVTSRYDGSIEHGLESAGRLEIRANDDDIKTYLGARMETIPLLAGLIAADESLHHEILNTVTEKASGMFLLAQLQIELLAEEDNKRAVRRALQNLPEEVDQMYDEAMRRIENQDRRKAQRAEEVLSWISYAERPLTIRELQHALATEPGDMELDEDALPDEDLPISVCAGLVTVDMESNVVRFVHYTTDEYFRRIREVRFPIAQTKITETCLTYLSLAELTNGPIYPPLPMRRAPEPLEYKKCQAQIQRYHLLEYSACFWGKHAHKCADDKLKPRILQFLQSTPRIKLSMEIREPYVSLVNISFDAEGVESITGLQLACFFGLGDMIRSLILENQTDVNVGESHGIKPLHIAAINSDLRAIEMLLNAGADPGQVDKRNRTPLYYAVECGHAEATQMLLSGTKDSNDAADCFNTKQALLRLAVDCGHLEVLHKLLATNVDVNYADIIQRRLLQYAVARDDPEVVDALLVAGADANAFKRAPETSQASRREHLHTALIDAAEHGNLRIVDSLLKFGAKVNYLIPGQALSAAAEYGHLEIVRRLLVAGENPSGNLEDVESPKTESAAYLSRETPLQAAAREGHLNIVKELLLANANVDANVANSSGFYWFAAVHGAARGGHLSVFQTLIAAGAAVDCADVHSGRTPLSYAAGSDHAAMVEGLLAREDVDPDSHDNTGRTPLSYAAACENDDRVQLFIDCKNVRIDSRDESGRTPLLWAAVRSNKIAVELLASHGADLNSKDNDGRTPFSHAAQHSHWKREQGEQMLFQWYWSRSDVHFDSRDHNGCTPLSWAAYNGLEDHVEALLKRPDVDANSVDEDGKTPLHYAWQQTAQYFLDRKDVLVDVKDKEGRTPLADAVRKGSTDTVLCLLDARDRGLIELDINSTDNAGRTPLFHATRPSRDALVTMLVIAGASVDVKDHEGKTPLDIAKKRPWCEQILWVLEGQLVNDLDRNAEGWRTMTYDKKIRWVLEGEFMQCLDFEKEGWRTMTSDEKKRLINDFEIRQYFRRLQRGDLKVTRSTLPRQTASRCIETGFINDNEEFSSQRRDLEPELAAEHGKSTAVAIKGKRKGVVARNINNVFEGFRSISKVCHVNIRKAALLVVKAVGGKWNLFGLVKIMGEEGKTRRLVGELRDKREGEDKMILF